MISETFNRKKTKTAKSVEIKERETTSREQLNMILNEGNHLNNTPSHKSYHAESGKKSSNRNIGTNHMLHNEGDSTTEKEHLLRVTLL